MFKYILKRIGISILILVAVSLIIYFMLRLMPVNYSEIAAAASGGTTEDNSALIAESLGLVLLEGGQGMNEGTVFL